MEELLLHGGVLLPVSSIVYCLTKTVTPGRAAGPMSEQPQALTGELDILLERLDRPFIFITTVI